MLKPPEFTKWLSRLRQTTDERIHHSAALKQATRETPGRSKNIRLDVPQFAIFLATAAAAVFTLYQARVAEHSRLDANEIAGKQFLLSRAYVAIDRVSLESDEPGISMRAIGEAATNHSGTFHILVRVFGSSPATDLSYDASCELGLRSGETTPLLGHAGPSVYLPGATIDILCPLTAIAIPHLNEEGNHNSLGPIAVVKGVVSYKDVFKNMHRTRFCYNSRGSWEEKNLTPCTEGNVSD